MDHFNWAMLIPLVGAVYVGAKGLDELAKLNRQIENVRFWLGELDKRQEKIQSHLWDIKHSVKRDQGADY
ncbi:hypothetical protein [Novosphingobium cyanobacteriorum]|uniref:Uncharacterized protein n=1 Tax=Novosphingobium cyanobacteriorum TaxID=3024215 RepID=A0ABT6CJR7_9SPHN|nr:hypothetical protein [Novosphingobium cyanobacteriorum]MDF8334136.1 hypothetical protein [Novosphingobium cyanobacteriorum]